MALSLISFSLSLKLKTDIFFLSLMTNDVKYVYMCLLAICISSLGKYLFKSFVYVFLLLNWRQIFFLIVSLLRFPLINYDLETEDEQQEAN